MTLDSPTAGEPGTARGPLPNAVVDYGLAMRSTWIRAWLATVALIVGAAAIARDRVDWLLTVEEPVLGWLLDGTDTSRWEAAQVISSPLVLIGGTLILVAIAVFLDWRVAIAIVVTSIIGTLATQLLQGVVGRMPPNPQLGGQSFPSLAVTQTGVFWGQIVLMAWWLRFPRLVMQLLTELGVVLTAVVAIRQILSSEIWPSDAIGSALVIGLSLITAALVVESRPVEFRWRRQAGNTQTPATSSSS